MRNSNISKKNCFQPNYLINLRLTANEADINNLGKAKIANVDGCFQEIKKSKTIREFFLLQKCNCIELYFVIDKRKKESLEDLINFWAKEAISLPPKLKSKIIIEEGLKVAEHLIRVATSLESLLLGDAQVLGQVRKASREARERKTIGPILNLILKYANTAGNRTRTETRLCYGNISIARVSAEIIESSFKKDAGKVLVIGAGKMGKLIIELLSSKIPAKYLSISNRSADKAIRLARDLKIEAVDFSSLQKNLKNYRYIVCALDSPSPLFENVSVNRISHCLTFLDIGNPPCVNSKVGLRKGITLLNLDYVRATGAQRLTMRKKEVEKVNRIVREEFVNLKKDMKFLKIQALSNEAYKIACCKSSKYLEKIPRNSLDDPRSRNLLVHGLVARILSPLANTKSLAQKDVSKAENFLETFLLLSGKK